ncbi:MAG: glycosyltransferase family 1 protein [bacterium]
MIIGIEASHANKSNRTGVEQVCWHLIQELKNALPKTARVILYTNKPLQGELAIMPDNWSEKVLSWPFSKAWSQIRLSFELLFNKPDVFFAPGQLVPFICPKNTITIVHDSAFRAFPSAYGFLSRTYLHWMNKLIVKKSKIIITPTNFSKQEFVKYYGFDVENIAVVPWGVVDNFFDQNSDDHSKSRFSSILGQKSDPAVILPYIISIGRLERKKNTNGTIRAFSQIKQKLAQTAGDGSILQNTSKKQYNRRNNGLKLVLVGSPGVGYDEIEQEIAKSQYKGDIIQLGWVDKELPFLLENARLLLFPSIYEGFGLPVLEAMASKCPAVLSDIPALKEAGNNAVLFADPNDYADLAEKTLLLLEDEQLRQKMIHLGFARAQEFSWLNSAKKVGEVLIN